MSDSPVVLITGATSGIGEAAARSFAASGSRVVLSGRRAEKGEAVVASIRSDGGEAVFFQADVSEEGAPAALVHHTLETFGRIDTAFNNAGIEGDTGVLTHEQGQENYERVFSINVEAVLNSMKAEIPAILNSGGGAIINNASIAGHLGIGRFGVYSASKHAVIGLTRDAALEYASQGLRINAVAPGPIVTGMYDRFVPDDESRAQLDAMVPLGRAGRPDEIVSAVRWLADPANSFTIGQVITVDGGMSVQ